MVNMNGNVDDLGHFDGSAEPNPGGRLGWGWHLRMGGIELEPGSGEKPADPTNTNNLGEYSGLVALLEDYIARGGQGPLEVRGDSQLVIKQVTGEYGCGSPHLRPYMHRARALASQIPGGVRFVWVRREQNSRADAAAGGRKPGAPGGESFKNTWANQTELGRRFNMSAIEIGRKLKEVGLRDRSGLPTQQAIDDGYCMAAPLRDGTPFFLWSIRKVTDAFKETGSQPLSKRELECRGVAAALLDTQKMWDAGQDKVASMADDETMHELRRSCRRGELGQQDIERINELLREGGYPADDLLPWPL